MRRSSRRRPRARVARSLLSSACRAQAARLSLMIGRCLRPAWNVTSIVSFAPGLPRTKAHGFAHVEPRGHLLRGSKRGRRLAGNDPLYTSLGVFPPSQVCGRVPWNAAREPTSRPGILGDRALIQHRVSQRCEANAGSHHQSTAGSTRRYLHDVGLAAAKLHGVWQNGRR